jgi:hypothetical protein
MSTLWIENIFELRNEFNSLGGSDELEFLIFRQDKFGITPQAFKRVKHSPIDYFLEFQTDSEMVQFKLEKL